MKINIKNIIAFLISLTLMFVLIITSLTMFFRGTILDPQTYIDVLEKNQIYDEIYENIKSNIDYFLLSNNMEEGVLDNVVNKDEIIQIVNDSIYYTVGYMKNQQKEIPTINIETFKVRVDEKITNYLREKQMYLDETFTNNIENLKQSIINIIKADLEIMNLNEISKSQPMKIISKASTLLDSKIIIITLLLAIIALSSLFFIVWKKRKSRRYLWIGYSFVSSGTLISLIGISGYISGFYNNIAIAIPYIEKSLGLIIKKCLLNLSTIGIVILIIGICFMAIYWKHLYKKYKKQNNLQIS